MDKEPVSHSFVLNCLLLQIGKWSSYTNIAGTQTLWLWTPSSNIIVITEEIKKLQIYEVTCWLLQLTVTHLKTVSQKCNSFSSHKKMPHFLTSFLTLIKNHYLFLYNFIFLFFKYEKYSQSLVPRALTSIVLLLCHC